MPLTLVSVVNMCFNNWSLYQSNLELDIRLDLGPGVALGAVDADALAEQHVPVSSHRPHVGPLRVVVSLQNALQWSSMYVF